MISTVRIVIIAVALVSAAPVAAVQPDEMLKDTALEARARELSRELRCMVCQNQSIDDSDAPLARDLRILVRERLQSGDSDAQVLDFLVARYGEFVLLKPRLTWRTTMLWAAPILILLAGLAGILLVRRHRPQEPLASALTDQERRRLAEIAHRDEGTAGGTLDQH